MAAVAEVFEQAPDETCAHLFRRVADSLAQCPHPFVPIIIHIEQISPGKWVIVLV